MPRRFLRGCLVVSLLGSLLGVTSAPASSAAPTILAKTTPAAGFATTGFGSWYAADITTELFSSPAIGDVDGDGGPDAVVGLPDGTVNVFRLPTGERWLVKAVGPGAIQASPTLVDLRGDGRLDILTATTEGHVVAFEASGAETFRVKLAGNPPQHLPGVFATPVASDIDGDGTHEIVVNSWDHYIHVFELNGAEQPGFPVFLKDTAWSSPAVADLDGDGTVEIVFGYDCDGVPGQDCYPARGGYVGVLGPDGRWRPGFPKLIPDQVVWSSPGLADLTGDGRLDIVVGTGNMPDERMPGGRAVYAFDASGKALPGWPVAVGGKTTSSPALGDLTGDGRADVAIVAEDGRLYGIRHDGATLFATCITNASNGCPRPLHASPSIAAVFGGTTQYAVVGGEQWLNVVDRFGNTVARGEGAAGSFPFTAAPSVANIGGKAWITAFTAAADGKGGWVGRLFGWTTGASLGQADWPTFRQNVRRLGVMTDTVAPTASLDPITSPSPTRRVGLSWNGADPPGGSGLQGFDVETNENGTGWVRWLSATSAKTAGVWTVPGHSMDVRVRARDRAGNVSAWANRSFTTAPGATGGLGVLAYAVGSRGALSGYNSPPAAGPGWTYPIARGVAVRPNGGGHVLDGWGAMHPFGGAPPISISGYWPGRDVARGVSMAPGGEWGYVVDWWGGLHPVGGAPKITVGPYWPGKDMARAVVLAPGTSKANPGGWVLDAWGGIHPFGSAGPVRGTSYWPGQDVARGLAMNSDGTGYVVDWWGGLHPVSGAARVSTPSYWPGRDVVRGVVSLGTAGSPAGYVLDNFGGMHPFGSAPTVEVTAYGPSFDARGVAVGR